MAVFSEPFTNLYGDGEVSGSSPDAQGDFYLLTDAQADHEYLQEKIADAISALCANTILDFLIIYGGVVSDGGSGTVNISECLCKTKDTNGKKRLVYIPALTGVALPSGWNDGRSIWVTARYDFKLGTLTRTHKLGGSYHYQIADTYMGDSAGYISTGTTDLFTTSNPVATATILGKFTMTGTTFANLGVRSTTLLGGKMGYGCAFGNNALAVNTGNNNSGIGYLALGINTTGHSNTALGSLSGSNIITGTNLTCIGYNSAASAANATNEITLGNSSIATLRCQVTSITSLSDKRDKTDVKDCDFGLEFINKVRPVKFRWDKREWYGDSEPDGTKKASEYTYNFIAQELDSAQKEFHAEDLNLVYHNNPDKLEATPANLIPVLVKSIQELSLKIDLQQKEISKLNQNIIIRFLRCFMKD